MSRTRRSFTTEYKVEAAHRVIDSGRTIAEVARELGVKEGLLGRWVADERRRVEAGSPQRGAVDPGGADRVGASAQTGCRAGERHYFPEKSLGVLCRQPTEVDRFELMAAECATTAITRMARLLGGVHFWLLQACEPFGNNRIDRSRTTDGRLDCEDRRSSSRLRRDIRLAPDHRRSACGR